MIGHYPPNTNVIPLTQSINTSPQIQIIPTSIYFQTRLSPFPIQSIYTLVTFTAAIILCTMLFLHRRKIQGRRQCPAGPVKMREEEETSKGRGNGKILGLGLGKGKRMLLRRQSSHLSPLFEGQGHIGRSTQLTPSSKTISPSFSEDGTSSSSSSSRESSPSCSIFDRSQSPSTTSTTNSTPRTSIDSSTPRPTICLPSTPKSNTTITTTTTIDSKPIDTSETFDPRGSIVSPLTCRERGKCIVYQPAVVGSTHSKVPTIGKKSRSRASTNFGSNPSSSSTSSSSSSTEDRKPSHEIYYELHGNGRKKAIMIMGLGNTSLAYAGQVRDIIPPLRRKEGEVEEEMDMDMDALARSLGEEGSSILPSSSNTNATTATGSRHWGSEYTICVFDNRGIGRSGSPTVESLLGWTTAGMARDTLCLLEHLGWVQSGQEEGEEGDLPRKRIDIVGTSLGGMISIELATMIPEWIGSLLLCVTMAGKKGKLWNMPSWTGLKSMLKTVYIKSPEAKAEVLFELCFPRSWLDAPMTTDPSRTNRSHMLLLFHYREANETKPLPGPQWAQSLAVLSHHVSDQRLAALGKIPKVCILTAAEDYLVDPRNSDHMAKVIPGAEQVVWEDAGHGINIQFPERYSELLKRVWAEGRGGQGC